MPDLRMNPFISHLQLEMKMKDGVKRLSCTFKLLLCTCYLISTSNISIANDLSVIRLVNVSCSWKPNDVSSMSVVHSPNNILLSAGGNDTNPSFFTSVNPVVVWYTNRDHPIGENTTLDVVSEQGLLLRDGNGSFMRSTNTSSLSAKQIHLGDDGYNNFISPGYIIYFFSYYGYNFMHLDPNKSSIDVSLGAFSGEICDYFWAFNDISMNTLYTPTSSQYADSAPSTIPERSRQSSCEPIFFRYYDGASTGNCTLPSELLTLKCVPGGSLGYKVMTFIQVQMKPASPTKNRSILYIFASLIGLVFITGTCLYAWMKQNLSRAKESDSQIDVFVDMVTRFSFESLKLATQDFKIRLGRGGFGSDFEGTLGDGTKIAVKQLNSFGQGNKEFMAEVNTIGSVHHFNLVRLLGFCDDGLNRLLVYEYMCNGSLEKWIFNQDISQQTLAWNIRRKIINGVAVGLEYLHEHCNQNVIHFDIKPQNILLDKDFNIKISDFGLAKMVDRDQSQVMTMVRGTPGYMAPELITGRAITVKVDVYSFGVLVLEIVCGRRNFGSSEDDCLTNLVKVKADEDQLSDLIDERGQDMLQHKEETVKMMKIAIWCLQPHFIRPTMSMVVKVLQDLPNMEVLSDLSYLTMVQEAAPVETNYDSAFRPTESLLSGPR